MAVNKEKYRQVMDELAGKATLVAVSKTKPAADILALYELGQRDFGENYVQELADKQAQLPKDIRWHFIGHLQSNKVKQIAPFVHLVHGIDSLKLLKEVDKQAAKNNRSIQVLLQMHIAKEETKFGLDESELNAILQPGELSPLNHICISGLMGMASFSDDETIVKKEFNYLSSLYQQHRTAPLPHTRFEFLSMGMSSDYPLAIASGSNMVRIGSLLFGERNYSK